MSSDIQTEEKGVIKRVRTILGGIVMALGGLLALACIVVLLINIVVTFNPYNWILGGSEGKRGAMGLSIILVFIGGVIIYLGLKIAGDEKDK